MLIDQINSTAWSELETAYGSADQVPTLLLALISENANDVTNALDGLYSTIYHQGDVYDSAVETLPHLESILSMDGILCRSRILHLVGEIAASEAIQKKRPGYTFYAIEKLLELSAVLFRLAEHKELAIRLNAVYPLAIIQELGLAIGKGGRSELDAHLSFLEDRMIKESNSLAQGSVACAAAYLAGKTNHVDFLNRFAVLFVSDIPKLTFTVQLGLVDFDISSSLDFLARSYQSGEIISYFSPVQYTSNANELVFPWFEGNITRGILSVFMKVRYCDTPQAATVFTDLIMRSDRTRLDAACDVVSALMTNANIQTLSSPIRKDSGIYTTLRAISANERLWDEGASVGGELQDLIGVSDTRRGQLQLEGWLDSAI